ncbi:MAG: Flp pilus assembly protein CpaB [Candidatus Dormibacteria bacterium]
MAVQPTKPPGRSNRLILLIGIVCAALAFGGVIYVLRQGGTNGSTTQVVVAKSDIEAGALLTQDSVKVASLPSDAISADTIQDPAAVTGKVAANRISANTPLVPALFQGAASSTKPGASAPSTSGRIAVDRGHVALAIPAALAKDEFTAGDLLSVGYYIQPGDHIDILIDPGQASGAPTGIRYSFQDVLVLRVGSGTSAAPAQSGSSAPAATAAPTVYIVELPRAQAEQLTALLSKRGTQSLVKYVLRPQEEYGKPGAPNYQDSTGGGVPAKQDPTATGDSLGKLFPR